MRSILLIVILAGLPILSSTGEELKSYQKTPTKSVRYASERTQHKFAGATRVVLDNFDPMDKEAKTASLQFDNNDVIFSKFGEPRVTTVFYKPFQVKLTRLKGSDPEGKDRCIFSVELPKEYAASLEENSLQLVASVHAKSQPRNMRLLLLNSKGQVTATLELRPPGTSSTALQFSVSDEATSERP